MTNYRRDNCKLFGVFPQGLDYPCFVTWAETSDEAEVVLKSFRVYGQVRVVTQSEWRMLMELDPSTFVKGSDPVKWTATLRTSRGLIQWLS